MRAGGGDRDAQAEEDRPGNARAGGGGGGGCADGGGRDAQAQVYGHVRAGDEGGGLACAISSRGVAAVRAGGGDGDAQARRTGMHRRMWTGMLDMKASGHARAGGTGENEVYGDARACVLGCHAPSSASCRLVSCPRRPL